MALGSWIATLVIAGCSQWSGPGAPTTIPGARVQALALALERSCLVTDRGQALCWGDGEDIWSLLTREPARPRVVEGIHDASRLALSRSITCALDHQGAVWCSPGPGRGAAPVALPRPIVQLDALLDGFCALDDGGRIWCWDTDVVGRRRRRSADRSELRRVPGVTRAWQLDAGHSHVCAVRDGGRAWCWGNDFTGLLGRGGKPAIDRRAPLRRIWERGTVPRPMRGVDDVRDLAALTSTTCMLTGDGSLYCVGNDLRDQGTEGPIASRTLPYPMPLPLEGAIVELVGGDDFACALDDQGRVSCFGSNWRGQLGVDAGSGIHVLSTLPRVRSIAAGWGHACAVDTDEALYCWGDNLRGAVGDGGVGASSTPVLVRRPAQAVALGDHHACALVGEELSCWGGLEPVRPTQVGVERPSVAPGPTRSVAALEHTTCRVRGDGGVVHDHWPRGPVGQQ